MIRAKNINVSFGAGKVLDNVSVEVRRGQVLAICGPNGAGKSTLLSVLVGDHKPSRDHVFYDGDLLAKLTAQDMAKRRAVLEQKPAMSADFTLVEAMELSVPREFSPSKTDTLISRIIDEIGLGNARHSYVSTLSGGQQHRAHLGRVLAQLRANSELGHQGFLMLDEPTASLDMAHQVATMKLARAEAQAGAGVIVVLHDLNLAAAFADDVVMLKIGRIAGAGPTQDILTEGLLSDVYDIPVMCQQTPTGQPIIQPVF